MRIPSRRRCVDLNSADGKRYREKGTAVLTPCRRHAPSGIASPKAKLVGRHEVLSVIEIRMLMKKITFAYRPLKHLLKFPKSCREHQATNRIP